MLNAFSDIYDFPNANKENAFGNPAFCGTRLCLWQSLVEYEYRISYEIRNSIIYQNLFKGQEVHAGNAAYKA